MQRGLTTLLEGVIDYAGLFPPAKLDIPTAVEEYLELQNGPHSWLVGRFAVSASRLPELGAELEKHELEEVLPLAVTGTSSVDRHHWKGALDHDLASLRQFATKHGDRAFVESLEIRIPSNAMVEDAIRLLVPVQVEDIFLELPWESGLEDAIAAIAGSEAIFAKARTGGAEKSAFPSTEQVALFLQHCVQLDLPFKLTAGLHHPLPHHDSVTGGHMQGFLNVLAGAALTYQEDLSVSELMKVLEEERPRAFEFSDDGLSWNGIDLSLETLEESRELFLCFGSCSIQEPVDGLAAAGFGVVAMNP